MQLDNSLILSGGNRLGYARYGRDGGIPAFYFHGLPGSRCEGQILHQACADAGVQLIAPERPGYGLSDPLPGERMRQWPALIAELADRLGFADYYLFAASGGAAYALACASEPHARVIGTGICCGLGEVSDPELRAGLRRNARLGFWLADHHPGWLRSAYGTPLTLGARYLPRLAIGVMAWLEVPPDRRALRRPAIAALFARNLHEAFRQGPAGGEADMRAALAPWPFDPGTVRSLQLWHGRLDPIVPLLHSERLAGRVPGTRLYRVDGEGHFSLPINCAASVVQAVLE